MSETEQLLPTLIDDRQDIYTDAIAKLCKHPELIEQLIDFPDSDPAGCLFFNAGKRRYSLLGLKNKMWLGNPAMIRIYPDFYAAQDDRITKKILEDKRLPTSKGEYGLVHLPILAEYQRYFDSYFDRHIKFVEYEGKDVLEENHELAPDVQSEGVQEEASSGESLTGQTDAIGTVGEGSEQDDQGFA